MELFLNILFFGIIGAYWRAWFGGSYGGGNVSRIWTILVLLLINIWMFYANFLNFNFLLDWKWYAMWLCFMRFWNHTHGDYFFVNDNSKDEARSWWVDKCLQLIFGKDNYYNYWGNVTGMFLGYTVPAISCAYFLDNWWFSIAGLIVAGAYGIMGKLYPNDPYTKYAEYISGFLVFSLLVICL